jgi:hypothetical protein
MKSVDEGTKFNECHLQAMSLAGFAEMRDFQEAVESLHTVGDESLACVMTEFVREIWKAKVKLEYK